MTGAIELSDSEGSVLDPIVSIRCKVTIDPGETAKVNFVTGIAETKASAMELIDKYHDIRMADRVYEPGLDSQPDDLTAAEHHRGGYPAISATCQRYSLSQSNLASQFESSFEKS